MAAPQNSIGIIGAGALGGYFGIRLAAAGWPVRFLLRSDFKGVREAGFHLVLSDGETVRLADPEVVDSPAAMGPVDWIIVALKTTRNAALPDLLGPVVRPGKSLLITLQNGLGNVEELERLYPDNPVVAGLCQIGVNREGPGRIRNFVPGNGFVQLGAGRRATGAQLDTVQAAFEAAGIHTRRTASLGEALWRKLMWNVPFNGLTVAIGGRGTDAVCGDPELRELARALMEEIRTAAVAQGFPIEPDYTDKLLHFTDKLGDYKASSVLDWLAGRALEVEAIFGKPLEAGTAAGIAMPHLATLTAILRGLGKRAIR